MTTSVCTGAFVLADAGLLEGRAATTHWSDFDELLRIDGSIEARPEARFVDEGDVITAAGISAGIDMALYLAADPSLSGPGLWKQLLLPGSPGVSLRAFLIRFSEARSSWALLSGRRYLDGPRS